MVNSDHRPGKKMSWFWSSGGSILTQIKKKCGPQNKYDTEKNTESRIFFTRQSWNQWSSVCRHERFRPSGSPCVHFSLLLRHDTHINTG